MFLISPDPNSQ